MKPENTMYDTFRNWKEISYGWCSESEDKRVSEKEEALQKSRGQILFGLGRQHQGWGFILKKRESH